MGDYGIWLMAPFGATAVLVFGVPQSSLAKPKNVIGGHMLTAMIGVVFSYYSADSAIMIGLAVGIAITLMMITKTIHPAAGANPILIIESSQSWDFFNNASTCRDSVYCGVWFCRDVVFGAIDRN